MNVYAPVTEFVCASVTVFVLASVTVFVLASVTVFVLASVTVFVVQFSLAESISTVMGGELNATVMGVR